MTTMWKGKKGRCGAMAPFFPAEKDTRGGGGICGKRSVAVVWAELNAGSGGGKLLIFFHPSPLYE